MNFSMKKIVLASVLFGGVALLVSRVKGKSQDQNGQLELIIEQEPVSPPQSTAWYMPPVNITLRGRALSGYPAPSMDLIIYDDITGVSDILGQRTVSSAVIGATQELYLELTDVRNYLLRGYMKLSNPAGTQEYNTVPLDMGIGQLPLGDVVIF